MDISGTPLNDSYHFGQTLINDYGRPYWQGVNNVTGFSTSANDGRFAFYVDGEYQYAPTIPAYPLSVRQVIANVDENPLQPPTPIPANQFALQDTYAMMKYAGLDWSVAKQSMWWGPGESGALLMSDNAAPFWMLQVNRMEPVNIPGLSRTRGQVVGSASAPPDVPTERDFAWFFKLFSLRGMVAGTERMCFFAYLQKTEDTFEGDG